MTIDHQLFFIVLALCFSGFIKGWLGLGFSTISLAIIANFIEIKTAISIVLIPSLMSNLIVMFQAGNFYRSIQKFWAMLLASSIGMITGIMILTNASTISVTILGIVLILYGSWGYLNRSFQIRDHLIKPLNPVIGFSTGIVNGATGSQIFPVMPYLLSLNISKDMLVQTINLSFTLSSIIMLGVMWRIEILNINSAITYSLTVFPVAISVYIGGRLRNKLSEDRFKQLVMILIVLLGFGLISKMF